MTDDDAGDVATKLLNDDEFHERLTKLVEATTDLNPGRIIRELIDTMAAVISDAPDNIREIVILDTYAILSRTIMSEVDKRKREEDDDDNEDADEPTVN